MDEEIQKLSRYLINEIVIAFGFKRSAATRRLFTILFGRVTERLSAICVETDRRVLTEGFPAATGWLASHWIRQVNTRGADHVPQEGPLLVVSNHVGAYDIAVAPSQINRQDIKIIASDSPFFTNLPNSSRHMIFTNLDPVSRMQAARQALRHLQAGGALLLFGTGRIDPDPAVFPDVALGIQNWSGSVDLFLREVPQAQVVVCILSGILLSKWAHSPLTWLRRIDWQKRRIAEYGQVLSQLFSRREADIYASMSIAPPVNLETLRRESSSGQVLPAVIQRGQALLADHVRWIQAIK